MGLIPYISAIGGFLSGAFCQIILMHYAAEYQEAVMTATAGMGLSRNSVEVANMLNTGFSGLSIVVAVIVFVFLFGFLTHRGG